MNRMHSAHVHQSIRDMQGTQAFGYIISSIFYGSRKSMHCSIVRKIQPFYVLMGAACGM